MSLIESTIRGIQVLSIDEKAVLCLDRREGGSCTSCCCRGTWRRRRRQCVTVARFHSWPDSNFDSAALIDPLLLPHSSESSYGLFAGNFVPSPLISRNLSARNLPTPSLSAYWPGWAAAGAVPLSLAAGEGERESLSLSFHIGSSSCRAAI